jgi:hypothetical protein
MHIEHPYQLITTGLFRHIVILWLHWPELMAKAIAELSGNKYADILLSPVL